MTPGAWLMLAVTWGGILYFTVRFFWKVATLPPRGADGDADAPRPGPGP